MNIEKVLRSLQNDFDLKDNHVAILQVLSMGDLDAREIAKRTKIPIGRIYDYLNELIKLELITKKNWPAVYVFDKKDIRVLDFMRNRIEQDVQSMDRIIGMLALDKDNVIEPIENKIRFNYVLIKGLSQSKACKLMEHESLPYIFYPDDSTEFAKVRKLISQQRTTLGETREKLALLLQNSFVQAFKRKAQFEYIVEGSSIKSYFQMVNKHLGSDYLKRIKNKIREDLKTYDMKITVIKGRTPMYMFIGDTFVVACLKHMGETTGFYIRNPDVYEFYDDLYQRIGQSAQVSIKKLLT